MGCSLSSLCSASMSESSGFVSVWYPRHAVTERKRVGLRPGSKLAVSPRGNAPRRARATMQDTLSEKLEALTETLGIMFTGSQITLNTDGNYWTFRVDGKALRFTENFLTSHDVDHVLTMCHAAISELKARPAGTTINVGGGSAQAVPSRARKKVSAKKRKGRSR